MAVKYHIIIYAVFVTALFYLFYQVQVEPTTVVAQSQEIVDRFQGTIEAREVYEKETEELSREFENQKMLFESKKSIYDSLQSGYSNQEKQANLIELERLRRAIFQLGEAVQQKAEEKEQILLEGIYNKINDFIKRYGKEKGYKVIIGTSVSGTLLYADDAIDITEDIIKELNEEYRGGLKKNK